MLAQQAFCLFAVSLAVAKYLTAKNDPQLAQLVTEAGQVVAHALSDELLRSEAGPAPQDAGVSGVRGAASQADTPTVVIQAIRPPTPAQA